MFSTNPSVVSLVAMLFVLPLCRASIIREEQEAESESNLHEDTTTGGAQFTLNGQTYIETAKLGEGAYGDVYAVKDSGGTNEYALKVINIETAKRNIVEAVKNSEFKDFGNGPPMASQGPPPNMLAMLGKSRKEKNKVTEEFVKDALVQEVLVMKELVKADPIHFVEFENSGLLGTSVENDTTDFGIVMQKGVADAHSMTGNGKLASASLAERLRVAKDIASIFTVLHDGKRKLVFPDFGPQQILIYHEGGHYVGKLSDVGELRSLLDPPPPPFQKIDTIADGKSTVVKRKSSNMINPIYFPGFLNQSKDVTIESDVYAAGTAIFQILFEHLSPAPEHYVHPFLTRSEFTKIRALPYNDPYIAEKMGENFAAYGFKAGSRMRKVKRGSRSLASLLPGVAAMEKLIPTFSPEWQEVVAPALGIVRGMLHPKLAKRSTAATASASLQSLIPSAEKLGQLMSADRKSGGRLMSMISGQLVSMMSGPRKGPRKVRQARTSVLAYPGRQV